MSDVITVIWRVIRGALLFLGYPPVAPGGDGGTEASVALILTRPGRRHCRQEQRQTTSTSTSS